MYLKVPIPIKYVIPFKEKHVPNLPTGLYDSIVLIFIFNKLLINTQY